MYKPGTIYGGEVLFECGLQRSITYFLEPLICMAPFSKLAFKLTLTGLTCDPIDATIDTLRMVNIRLLRAFGLSKGVELTSLRAYTCWGISTPTCVCTPTMVHRLQAVDAAIA